MLILGLQGSVFIVLGAGHVWFITSILICYLLTPVIKNIIYSKHERKLVLFIFVPCFLALVEPAWPSTLLDPLVTYSFGFLAGKNINKIVFRIKYFVISGSVLILVFGIRFISRFIFDGTIIYDRIIAYYCSLIGAFCIFYILSYIFKTAKVNRFI